MNSGNEKLNNSNRAMLLQTMQSKNLSQYCLRLITDIVVRAKNQENVARDITEILHEKNIEQDIIDQLELWYRYVWVRCAMWIMLPMVFICSFFGALAEDKK